MKNIVLILQVLLVLTAYSCGKEEIPQIQKPVIAADDFDADGLSSDDEKELGTHEHIADFPIHSLEIIDEIKIDLKYNFQGNQKQLTLSRSSIADTTEYMQDAFDFLSKPIDDITPIEAKIELNIKDFSLLNQFTLQEVKNLNFSVYTYIKGQRKNLIENKVVENFPLQTTLKLESLTTDPLSMILAVYHGAGIYIEVNDYLYQHPISEKELSYAAMLSVQNESCGVAKIKDSHFDLNLCAIDLTFSKALSYFEVNLSDSINDFSLEKGLNKTITTKAREHKELAFRSLSPVKTLKRINGKVVENNSELITNSEQLLVKITKQNFSYSEKHKLYPLTQNPGGGIAQFCGCSVRSVYGSSEQNPSLSLLTNIVDLGKAQNITQLNSSTWLIQSKGSLQWFLRDNLSEYQIIGDYLNKCQSQSQYIYQYDKAEKHYSEKLFVIEITEILNH